MSIEWKEKMLSQRTLGRLIRFQLLLALIFFTASLLLWWVPSRHSMTSTSNTESAKAIVRSVTHSQYPFVRLNMAQKRSSLFGYGELRREETSLLVIEKEEPIVVELTEQDAPEGSNEKASFDPLPEVEGLTLVGTINGSGSGSIAIVRDDNGGETVYVRVGDTLNGSLVEVISANAVRVKRGDQRAVIEGSSFLRNNN